MSLIPNPTNTLIEQVLSFRNHRHDVIAANIANSSTPGYRSFDLLLDAASGGSALPMRTSDARHLGSSSDAGAVPGTPERSRDPAKLDGNNVSLDAEFVKLTENRLMYQTAFELYENFGALTRLAREVR